MHASPLGCVLYSTEILGTLFRFPHGERYSWAGPHNVVLWGALQLLLWKHRGSGCRNIQTCNREGCCCRCNDDFVHTVSLHCHRAGAVRFVISLLASAKCAAERARTPVYMAWDEENCSGVIFPNTHFDSSLHSYPLQAWERTKEIHSWAPFYRAWVNNNIIGDSLQMFCLAWVNSQSLCANNTEASVIYPASQWKLVAAPRMKSHSLRGSCPLFKG